MENNRNAERFRLMALRLAKHLNMTTVDRYEEMPLPVQNYFVGKTYIEVVLPLMINDKEVKGLSLRGLETKYGVPKSTIGYHLGKKK